MRGDYSRKTFDRRKHYSGVLMQQGRVQVDADWNEQLYIQAYRTEAEAIDVIGPSGVPKGNTGFKIGAAPGGRDLTIAAGRMYVDGLLCELDQPATYTKQPYFPSPDYTAPAASPPDGTLQLTLADGSYLAYLDVWQREITARDDVLIHEVALGGPDTGTRLQNVYQVRLYSVGVSSPLSPLSPLGCDTPIAMIDDDPGLSTGTMNARTQPPQSQSNPCVLPPSAGYTRLENQLYRVEIHTPGPLNQATFKWARDAVETTIQQIAGNVLTVAEVGPDKELGFSGLQWVEILDDESTLKRTPNPLAQIDSIDPDARTITLKSSMAALANRTGLKLRRWEQSGPSASATGVDASMANWIDLEGGIQVSFSTTGTFNAGDYWLIPARTVTGEIEWPPYQIPNVSPVAQPPRGIRRHFARLALVDVIGGAVSVREDCRKPFPPLTDICAEDVCFESAACNLEGAETVQQAIDRLCQERDLRFHKKHLHGWGIVCGLQVHCGPDTRSVTVKPGYAISCEGDDIRVLKQETIDLLALVAGTIGFPAASPGGTPDADVCLILDSNPNSARRFSVELYTGGKSAFKDALQGTLLLDFFNDCIKSLVDFFVQETTPQPGESQLLVGPTQKRLTTFANLLIQLLDPKNGAFVFLSGDKLHPGSVPEHEILRQFYIRLRQKLQSHTFCAMFDGARAFPNYPLQNLDIATIFSKGQMSRFRVSPDGRVGYAVGSGNTINVFDLAGDEMAAELVFPGGPGAAVQDVALSANGSQLFAVALINNKDTMFAVADISGKGLVHAFKPPTLICDVLLVTLGMSPATSGNVIAIGKNKGLYSINPANVDVAPQPFYTFNAVGHLAIDAARQTAYATASSGAAVTRTYNHVMKLSLGARDNNPPVFPLLLNNGQHLTGEDDIALGVGPQEQSTLFVVVNPPAGQTTRHALVYLTDAVGAGAAPALVDLKQSTNIRLAHNRATGHMMVAYEDLYRVGMVNQQNALMADFVPVQIGPVWVAPSPDDKRVYVLNYWSRTISAVPASRFDPGQQIPLQTLTTYRADILNAFADLLGGLLQYLKDCFCDHLLVNCPTCDTTDKIYLACISIKNNKVFKVCNFSHRKYVHSFPTWEYWLSIVPVLPFIKKAVEAVCCAALPGFFGRFTAKTPPARAADVTAPQNIVKSAQIRDAVTAFGQANFKGAVGERLLKIIASGDVVNDALGSIFSTTFAPSAPLAHSDIVGRPIADARAKLDGAHVVVVDEEAYDPRKGGRNLSQFVTAPIRLEAGERVTLVTRDGKVVYYRKAGEELSDIVKTKLDESSYETDRLRHEVSTLRDELWQARQGAQDDLLARDAQIVALHNAVRDAQAAADEGVKDLQKRLDRLERTPSAKRTPLAKRTPPPKKG